MNNEQKNALTKVEYSNLCRKANNGYVPVNYFRKNFFNSTTKVSGILKRPKVIYSDDKITIKINRSLHQKHRDLLSVLMYEKNSKPNPDGSYKIKTNIYRLAKIMGYAKPENNCHTIKGFLDEMRSTDITTVYENEIRKHMMLGESWYNSETKEYEIEIPAKTAKYVIQATCVQIPKEMNQKIVRLPNSMAKIKALLSFLLSNKRLQNGISFCKICEKLEITDASAKSRLKTQVKKNIELLKEFEITFLEDIFYTNKQTTLFERAVTQEEVAKIDKQQFYDMLAETYNLKIVAEISNTKFTFQEGEMMYCSGTPSADNPFVIMPQKSKEKYIDMLYSGELQMKGPNQGYYFD